MSVESQAVSALKWTAAAKLVGQVGSWAATLLVFRLLSPQDYGLMAIVSSLLSIGAAIAEFGLGAALVQARQLDRILLARLAGAALLFHLGLLAITLACAPLAAAFYQDERLGLLIQAAALQFLFAAVSAVPYAMAVRAMNFRWLARVEVIAMLLGSLSTVALALLDLGAWALVGGMLAGAAMRALLLVAGGENVRPSFRFAGLGAHLDYSAKTAGSHVLWTVVSQSDVIIGGRLLSRDALGLYSVALHLATLPMQKIMSVVNQVVFASVARLQDETERLRLRLLQGMRLTALGAVGMMWGLAAVAPELVRIVLGAKWEPAIPTLQLISVVVPVRMMVALLATAVSGVGAANVGLRNTLTAALVWPVCFAVGAQWGSTGLAAAWLIASPLTFALNARRIGAVLGVRVAELLRLTVEPVLAGLLMVAAVHGTRLFAADAADLLRLPLLIAVGAAAYAAALLLIDRRVWSDVRRLARAARA